jgi:hypothetical protein
MLISRKIAAVALTAASVFGSAAVASAQEPAAETASCMGLGSAFYGQFAPQQRAFVALYVNDLEGPAGDYYTLFAQEKEGGAIAAPCGTRLE